MPNLKRIMIKECHKYKSIHTRGLKPYKKPKHSKKTHQNSSQQPPHSAEPLKRMNSSSPKPWSYCSSSNQLKTIFFSLLHFVCRVLSLDFAPRIMVLTNERKTNRSTPTLSDLEVFCFNFSKFLQLFDDWSKILLQCGDGYDTGLSVCVCRVPPGGRQL